MEKLKGAPITIEIDASEMDKQIGELMQALTLQFGPLESLGNDVISAIHSRIIDASSDVITGEYVPTVNADGTNIGVYSVRLGGAFESLIAAVRAGDFYLEINSHK